MSRVGKNPNWNRFNLIIKKIICGFNLPNITQPELIARCYDWIEPFAKNWEEHKLDDTYTSWLIYRGIGSIHSSGAVIPGIYDPAGLLNNCENRKKAAQKIRKNFMHELSEMQFCDINSRLIKFLESDQKDGFVPSFSRRVSDTNPESMAKYICSYLIPALELIEDPYEKLAAILIYAQSGCIPLDVSADSHKELSENRNNGINEIYRSSDYRELNDPFFCGTFYGYFRQYHSESGEGAYKGLVPFELTIENNGMGANAVMKFNRFLPNRKKIPIRMTGKPMIGQQTIHIVLQAESGDDSIIMSYKWISLKNSPLQSRQGILVTMDRAERCPQVQHFVFFNQPISKENEKYVDAFLRFSGDRFIVSNESIAEFSEETVQFLKKYGNSLNGYLISARQAISNAQYDDMSDYEIIKELLEIKRHSLSPLIINAKEEKQVSDFFRAMLGGNRIMVEDNSQ